MAQKQGGYRPPDADYNASTRGPAGGTPQVRQVQRTNTNSGQTLTPQQKQERIRRAKYKAQQRKRRRNRIILGFLLILVLIVGFIIIRRVNGMSMNAEMELDALDMSRDDLDDEAEEALYNGPPIATISFVGDISTSADQVADALQPDNTYNFNAPFEDIKQYFDKEQVAYAVADFETTMVDDLEYGGEPYYNSPIQLAGSLRNLGIRLVSTANTYALNNGIEGVVSTKNYLTVARLRSVGTYLSQEDRDTDGGAYIRDIHKIKFAFLSYTKGTESVTMPQGCEYALNTLYEDYADYWSNLRASQIRSDIQAAKDAGAEVIVALLHWGSELSRNVSQPQEELADMLLQNGVDVIIGTHSHLVNKMGFQKVALSDGSAKNCFVAYGLGDFYTDPQDPRSNQSMILNLTFSRDDSGRVTISDASYVPIYMHVYEEDGEKHFRVLDVYSNLAELKRIEKDSAQSELFNALLDTIDTMHNYAGAEMDVGPTDKDQRIVTKAIDEGPVPALTITALKKAELDAQRRAEAAAEEGVDEDTETTVTEVTAAPKPQEEEAGEETGETEEVPEE